MTRGKVVLVPFPFDDLSSSKVRPAVCLADPIGPYRHVVVAFLTSRVPTEVVESDLLLDSRQTDFVVTGLRVTSVLRLHRLMTVTSDLIRRELGALSTRQQAEVTSRLKKLFGLV